jgi:hypothetical protein
MDPMEGGCSKDDVEAIVEEQAKARGDDSTKKQASGLSPLPVIWRGPVLTELQLAQASSCGCTAVVLSWRLLGPERAADLMEAAPAYGLEVIAEVLDKQEAKALADLCEKLPKDAKVKLVLVGEGLSVDATCELFATEHGQDCTGAGVLRQGQRRCGQRKAHRSKRQASEGWVQCTLGL